MFIPTKRLPSWLLFSDVDNGWKIVRGERWMTLESMKSLTGRLGRTGVVGLLDWDPRDPPKRWLDIIDMVQRRS